MRTFLTVLALALPATVYALAQDAAIGLDGARHLLGRTGFAASDSDIRAFATLSRPDAADRLISAASASTC